MNKYKILVCDDEQSILDIIQLMLETVDFRVMVENDSSKVISKIKEFSPDILLLDLWMPKLSGDQVLKQIRNDLETKNLPVIVLSASVNGDDVATDAGADSFVAKPFDMDDLITKINNLLLKTTVLEELSES